MTSSSRTRRAGSVPSARAETTVYEYAIRYPDSLIHDPSWRCIADVVASYAEGSYTDGQGRVTGVLVRAPLGTMAWETVQ